MRCAIQLRIWQMVAAHVVLNTEGREQLRRAAGSISFLANKTESFGEAYLKDGRLNVERGMPTSFRLKFDPQRAHIMPVA
jgi:hypothetical protein